MLVLNPAAKGHLHDMKGYRVALILLVIFATGCAHNISINPDTSRLIAAKMEKIDYSVGYHISADVLDMAVETPGGGGDNVTYTPYRDSESALFTVLSKKFANVYLVKSMNDNTFIEDNEIKLIFLPTITTNSSSSSLFTWPPTYFSVDLSVKALNHKGEIIWQDSIYATGEAEFSEFKSDFGLAAKRATEKAFMELAKKIENVPEL